MENSSSLEIKNVIAEMKEAVEDKLQEISQKVEHEDKEIENRKDKKIWRTVQEVLYVNRCFQKEEIEGRKKEPDSRDGPGLKNTEFLGWKVPTNASSVK